MASTLDSTTPALDDTEVIDKYEFARLLKKSVRSIDRLRRAGLLPAPLIHGRWSRRVVLRWLDEPSSRRRR